MNLKDKVKNNTTAYYLYSITKGLFNREYKEKVAHVLVEKEDEYHIIRHGDENIGKTIFLYDEDTPFNGFFAIYRFMIETCWFCERHGFIPVFHIGDNGFYGNNGVIINGKDDAYEQYFMQPTEIDYKSAMRSYSVIYSSPLKRDLIRKEILGKQVEYLGYEISDEYLKLMAEYAGRCIRLNPIIRDRLDSDISSLLINKRTLGVHVRIKSFQRGIDRHPVAGTLQEYIEESKIAMKQGDFEQLFLASVEPDTVEAFKEEFGDRLIVFSDVLRSEIGEPIYEKGNRENHKYLLGFEALRDMYALARCDGIIAGLSQVSFSARFTKIQEGKPFDYTKIIDHGITHSSYTVNDFLKSKQIRVK